MVSHEVKYSHCYKNFLNLTEQAKSTLINVITNQCPNNNGSLVWGRLTHICIGILSIIGADNGLSPGQRQSIIWTNAGIFLIGPLGTNFSEILAEIITFSFKKMYLKVLSAKFCLGLNVLNNHWSKDMDE